MRRAIVVTIVVALIALAAVLIWNGGQSSEPRRPAQETKRNAPGPIKGGFAPGTEAAPETAPPADE